MINPFDNFKVEEDKIIFTIPEPEMYNKRLLRSGIKIKSNEYISWEVANEHFKNINSITKQKRNEIYNKFTKGGISIGETAKLFSVSTDVVADVISFNIVDVPILRGSSI